jgi:hypothetical protein
MAIAREEQFLAKATERGWVTAEQVEAARRRQAGPDAPQSLLTLLLEAGHLTREQVVELVTGRPATGAPAEQEGDAALDFALARPAEPKPDDSLAAIEAISLSGVEGAAPEPAEEAEGVGGRGSRVEGEEEEAALAGSSPAPRPSSLVPPPPIGPRSNIPPPLPSLTSAL